MTVTKLIKELEKLKKLHGPRAEVVVSLTGTKNMQLDTWHTHIPVDSLQADRITWYVDDSCELANGTERTKLVVTLNGE